MQIAKVDDLHLAQESIQCSCINAVNRWSIDTRCLAQFMRLFCINGPSRLANDVTHIYILNVAHSPMFSFFAVALLTFIALLFIQCVACPRLYGKSHMALCWQANSFFLYMLATADKVLLANMLCLCLRFAFHVCDAVWNNMSNWTHLSSFGSHCAPKCCKRFISW